MIAWPNICHATSRAFASVHMDGRLFWRMTILVQTRWGAHLKKNRRNTMSQRKKGGSICFSRNQWCHAATVVYHTIRFVSHNYSVVLCHTVGLRLFDKPNCKRSWVTWPKCKNRRSRKKQSNTKLRKLFSTNSSNNASFVQLPSLASWNSPLNKSCLYHNRVSRFIPMMSRSEGWGSQISGVEQGHMGR